MTKPLWQLPFASSWGGNIKLFELLKRNLALTIEGGEEGDLQIVFEQVEAYKCTYHFAQSNDMLIAYDKLVDLEETSWLIEVRNQLRQPGEYVSSSPTHGPPDQLKHLMINFDDGPCYEFLCQKFSIEKVPFDPERWKMS